MESGWPVSIYDSAVISINSQSRFIVSDSLFILGVIVIYEIVTFRKQLQTLQTLK